MKIKLLCLICILGGCAVAPADKPTPLEAVDNVAGSYFIEGEWDAVKLQCEIGHEESCRRLHLGRQTVLWCYKQVEEEFFDECVVTTYNNKVKVTPSI